VQWTPEVTASIIPESSRGDEALSRAERLLLPGLSESTHIHILLNSSIANSDAAFVSRANHRGAS
jgi:hypothetical protein